MNNASHTASANPALITAMASPAGFAMHVDPMWKMAPHLEVLNKALVDLATGRIRRLIVQMPPRHGKPLAVTTRVLMADGSLVLLGDIVPGNRVIAQDGMPHKVLEVHDQGILPTIEIKTRWGRSIKAAHDHPFLTHRGWVQASELKPKDKLKALNCPQTEIPDSLGPLDEAFRLAGYFIGDGCVTKTPSSHNCNITCVDDVEYEDIKHCAKQLGFFVERRHKKQCLFREDINRPREWIREIGIAGHGSHTKRVPKFVFKGTSLQVANFLGAYWATDGSVNKAGGARRDACVEYSSTSHGLLLDTQHLLARLGIRARVFYQPAKYKGGYNDAYRINITGRQNVARFARIKAYHSKAQRFLDWGFDAPTDNLEEPSWLGDDPVKEISPSASIRHKCLTVEGNPTFVADGVVVHNSELCSRFLPAWFLSLWPDKRVILTAYEASFAMGWGRKARDLYNEFSGPLFGLQLHKEKKAASEWLIHGRRGAMVTAGVGGSITGKGAHLFIIDDPVKNAEEANSKVKRQAAWDFYLSTARTRIEPGGSMLLIMTRWHEDDLAGRLLRQQEKSRKGPSDKNYWHLISFPAFAEENDPLHRPLGAPLWPARYDTDDLQDIQDEMVGESGGAYWFTALFQQRPAPEEGGLFKSDWFKFYTIKDQNLLYGRHYEHSLTLNTLDTFTVSDTALTDKEQNDPTVTSCWGVHRDRRLLVLLSLTRKHLEGPDILPQIHREGAPHGAKIHWIEKSTASLALIQSGRRNGMPIRELIADKSKHARALNATPHFSSGHVLFPLHAPFMPKFLEELLQFPNAKHDDQVDVVAYAAGICFPQYSRVSKAPSLTRRPHKLPQGYGINAPQRLLG